MSDDSYKKFHEQAQPIDYIEKAANELNQDADIKFEGSKGLMRPPPLSQEERDVIQMKIVLQKLYERGKSTTNAFLDLDSDRDGIVTQNDLRKGLQHRLGIPLREEQIDLLSKHLGREWKAEGQEFKNLSLRLKIWMRSTDILMINMEVVEVEVEGPVAAAVGQDAVLNWKGSGNIETAITISNCEGFNDNGSSVSFSGSIQNAETARKEAIKKALNETPNKEARRGGSVLQIGERLSQKRSDKESFYRHGYPQTWQFVL